MKKVVFVLLAVLGAYLIVRAVAEPFVIDVSDPATFRDDWGGPSLVGVLAVHIVPGLVAAVVMGVSFVRWRRSKAGRATHPVG